MPTVEIHGGTGRLGMALVARFLERGDSVYPLGRGTGVTVDPVNYLIFAQRYRWQGEQDPLGEFNASVVRTQGVLESVEWAGGDCAVVIVSSLYGVSPGTGQNLWYALGKAAAIRLAQEHAHQGKVRTNVVSPAAFTGVGQVVSIPEVVDVIEFLASPKSAGINGQNIIIDKGMSLRWT